MGPDQEDVPEREFAGDYRDKRDYTAAAAIKSARQSLSGEAKADKPITTEIATLEFQIEELASSIKRLEADLEGVVTPMPSVAKDSPLSGRGSSQLYSRLERANSQLKDITDYVRELTSRLEV